MTSKIEPLVKEQVAELVQKQAGLHPKGCNPVIF